MTVTCKGWSARNLRWAVEPSGSLMRMAAMSGLPAGGSACRPAFLFAFRCCRAEARSVFFFSAASCSALHLDAAAKSCAVCFVRTEGLMPSCLLNGNSQASLPLS